MINIMDLIILIILILFYYTKNNTNKSLLLLICLGYTLYALKGNNNNNIESFVDISELKKILNECCNKKEMELITKKIECVLNNKNTYKYLINNANKIIPSKKSVIDILFKMF